MTSSVDFHRAGSLDEAVSVLGEWGSEACPMAGGTDVMIQLRLGQLNPRVLLYLGDLPDADGIVITDRMSFGALTTHEQVWRSPEVSAGLAGVACAARQVGGWQTQTIGTVVGNVANASPAADLVPALLTAGGQVELTGPRGVRIVPLDSFVVGRRKVARDPDELVTRIIAEPAGRGTADHFVKVGRRSAMEVSIVAVSVRMTAGADGSVQDCRIAVGAAGPVPFRAVEAEQMLRGVQPDPAALREAAHIAAARGTPIDDIRASARYRRQVLPRVILQALNDCLTTLRRDQEAIA